MRIKGDYLSIKNRNNILASHFRNGIHDRLLTFSYKAVLLGIDIDIDIDMINGV